MQRLIFQEINIWQQVNEDTFYCFRGFQNLQTGKYCFFNCDHIHRHDYDNVAIQKHQEFAFRQNLFAGGLDKIDESETFDSIEEAIANFDGD